MDKRIPVLVHYGVVFGVLAWTFPVIMDYWGNDLSLMASAFAVFVLADQIAHKVILGEDFSL